MPIRWPWRMAPDDPGLAVQGGADPGIGELEPVATLGIGGGVHAVLVGAEDDGQPHLRAGNGSTAGLKNTTDDLLHGDIGFGVGPSQREGQQCQTGGNASGHANGPP